MKCTLQATMGKFTPAQSTKTSFQLFESTFDTNELGLILKDVIGWLLLVL